MASLVELVSRLGDASAEGPRGSASRHGATAARDTEGIPGDALGQSLRRALEALGEATEGAAGGGTERLDRLEAGAQALTVAVVGARAAVEARRAEAARREREAERDERLCVICLTATKATLLLPCRHLCVCRACSQHRSLDKCPVCRTRIAETLDVYT